MMVKWIATVVAVVLSGCVTTGLSSDSGKVSPPSGIALPVSVPVMVHVSRSDLERALVIERTRFRDQETDFKDGAVMARASEAVLRQVFASVAANDPATTADLIVRPMAKAKFSLVTGLLKIGCGLDVLVGDGRIVGSYVARQDFDHPVDFRDMIPPAYAACLKKAADEMMRSPIFARIAAGRMSKSDPAGRAAFLRSLTY